METIEVIEVGDLGTSFDRNTYEESLESNLFANPELLSREMEGWYKTKEKLNETNPSLLARNIAETGLVSVVEGESITFVTDKEVKGLDGNYAPGSTITMDRFHTTRKMSEKNLARDIWKYIESDKMVFSDDKEEKQTKSTPILNPEYEQFVFVELDNDVVDLLNLVFSKFGNEINSRDLEHVLKTCESLGLSIKGNISDPKYLKEAIGKDLMRMTSSLNSKREIMYSEFRKGHLNRLTELVRKLPDAEKYMERIKQVSSIDEIKGLPKDIIMKMKDKKQCGMHDPLLKEYRRKKSKKVMLKLKDISTEKDGVYHCNHCNQQTICTHDVDYFDMKIDDLATKYKGKRITHYVYCVNCGEELLSTEIEDELNKITFEKYETAKDNSLKYGEEYERKSSMVYGSVSSIIGKLKSKKNISQRGLIKTVHSKLLHHVLSLVNTMNVQSTNKDNMIRLVASAYASVYAMKIFMSSGDFYIPEVKKKNESDFIKVFIKDIHTKFSTIADESFVSNLVRKAYSRLKEERIQPIREIKKTPDVIPFVDSCYFRPLYEMYCNREKGTPSTLYIASRILNKPVSEIRVCEDVSKLPPPPNMTDREKQIYHAIYDPNGPMFNHKEQTPNYVDENFRGSKSIDRKVTTPQKLYPIEYHISPNGEELIWELKKVGTTKTKPSLMTSGIHNNGNNPKLELVPTFAISSKNRNNIEKNRMKKLNLQMPEFVKVSVGSDSSKKSNNLKSYKISDKRYSKVISMAGTHSNSIKNIGRTVNMNKIDVKKGNFKPDDITMKTVKVVESYIWSISRLYNKFINNIDGQTQMDFYKKNGISFLKITSVKSFPSVSVSLQYDYDVDSLYYSRIDTLLTMIEKISGAPLIGSILAKEYVSYITKSEMVHMKNDEPKRAVVISYGDDEMELQKDVSQEFMEDEDSENMEY